MSAGEQMVAALYVETNGVYFGLDGVDPWDEARDARLYAGPWPVVAHPPCKRYCRFAKGIETRYGYEVGDDGGCFEAALEAVRTFGGVIEHPAGSLAWDIYGLPKPKSSQGWTASLSEYGASCYIEQGRYGCPVKKATWLYAYGVDLPNMRWGKRLDSEPSDLRWSKVRYRGDEERERVVASETWRTPLAFRDVLLGMAQSVSKEPAQ